jgi:hypothetical protein
VVVHLYGGVVPYVVSLGVDLTTEYGRNTLTWHQDLYDAAREMCGAGGGHGPYNPFPYHQVYHQGNGDLQGHNGEQIAEDDIVAPEEPVLEQKLNVKPTLNMWNQRTRRLSTLA